MDQQITPVDLSSAILRCNLFNFFYSASKSALIPFLTLFLRILGFTAVEVGIIIGAKTLSSFIFAPIVASIAIRLRARRFFLMFSIFMMAVTYLSLTTVPYINVDGKYVACKHNIHDSHPASTTVTPVQQNMSHFSHSSMQPPQNTDEIFKTTTFSSVTYQSTKNGTFDARNSTTLPSHVSTISEKNTTDKDRQSQIIQTFLKVMKSYGIEKKDIINQTPDELYSFLRKKFPHQKNILTKDQVKTLLNSLKAQSEPRHRRSTNSTSPSSVNVEESNDDSWMFRFLHYFKVAKDKVTEMKIHFIIVIVILCVGELFCSPVEKIADDCWFDFLEGVDNLEKYGKQRIWGSFAAMLCPLIVASVVDNTVCLFQHIDHFMIHFYAFGGLLGITFLLAFFYPSPKEGKQKYVNKVWQGFRVVCCNCRGMLYVITLLIMGIVYASVHNFLFWVIQDLHGKEITMGMCITIATLSELPMLLFGEKLVQKFGNSGVVCIALVFLSVRVLYYSFLWTPWAVLLVEPLHAFTHTAMWWAVLSCKQFNIAPSVDRSIRSIMSSVYFGIGYSAGSFISGFVYDWFEPHGYTILYKGAAVLVFAWFPVFALLNKCLPKGPRIKYERLLNQDDLYSDSDSQDDWLETAMNSK